MTDEEINKKFDEMFEQLDKTSAETEELKSADDKFDRRMNRIEGAIVGLYSTSVNQSKQIEENGKQIQLYLKVVESQGEQINKQSKQIRSLGLAVEQMREDNLKRGERLDNFIIVLEKYIAREQNGSTDNS